MRGSFVCLCFMIAYYCLLVRGLKAGTAHIRIEKRAWAIFSVMSLAAVTFSCLFVLNEHFIYFWDYGSYWYMTIHSGLLEMSAKNMFQTLWQSINYSEYNLLLSTLIALPLKLCGNSYAAFVILNTILFYIPNAIALLLTTQVVMDRIGLAWHKQHPTGICAGCLFFSVYLLPVLSGYIDIASCPVLVTAYCLVISRRDFNKLDIKRDVLISLLIIALLLMRRYFAYAIIGGAAFIVPYWLIEKRGTRNRAGIKLIDMGISIIPPFAILFLAFPLMFRRYFFNNYDKAYSAYSSLGFLGNWVLLVRHFGILITVFVLISIVVCRNFEQIKITVCLLLSTIVTASVFFKMQDMGQQHYYVLLFQIVTMMLLGFVGLEEKVKPYSFQKAIEICFIAVILVNFCMQFGISLFNRNSLFVSYIVEPRNRNDIEQIQKLDLQIDELVTNGSEGVYCTASSVILNSDICNKAFGAKSPLHFIVDAADVDLRDGFHTAFFDADIIISTETAQTHLSHGQEIINVLNTLFLNETEFSRKYLKVGTYVLDEGVTAYIWVKQKELSRRDIVSVQEMLSEIYPDEKELFFDRIQNYLMSKNL